MNINIIIFDSIELIQTNKSPSAILFPAVVLETRPNNTKYSLIIVPAQFEGLKEHFEAVEFQPYLDPSITISNSRAIS